MHAKNLTSNRVLLLFFCDVVNKREWVKNFSYNSKRWWCGDGKDESVGVRRGGGTWLSTVSAIIFIH